MNGVNVVLTLIIAYIIYLFASNTNNNKKESLSLNSKNQSTTRVGRQSNKERFVNSPNYDDNRYVDDLIDDVISWDGSNSTGSLVSSGPRDNILFKGQLNPNMINNQFHNDYRDLITALNNLVPDRKQLFNLPNIPLVYSEPEVTEVGPMVSDFVEVVNENLRSEVPSYRNPNSGWDEAITDPNTKSGWDKVQESLGLPTSLYDDPAGKGVVKVVAIRYVQKYETEDEIKYSIDMVLQKVNVEDQMVIKADFVQDKRPIYDENNFFRTSNVEMKVTIENIFIIGYLSHYGPDSKKIQEKDEIKYYDYNKLEYNNMTDPKYIQKVLMEKYRQRNEEMEQRTAMLDEEAQSMHRSLPHMYDFSNIRGTQTIFDDMNTHRNFI